MAEIVADYDPAENLDAPEAITVFVNPAYIAHASGVVARARVWPG